MVKNLPPSAGDKGLFDHWAGRIENAEEQLSLGTTATEPEP